MTGPRGKAIFKKPPTWVQRRPKFSTTKKPLTARYTMIDVKMPTCENVNLAERLMSISSLVKNGH